jgi:hypothetical protein
VSKSKRRLPFAGLLALSALVVGTMACTVKPAPTPTAPGTKTIKYGPFTIPGMNQPGTGLTALMPLLGLTPETGMIWNLPVQNVQKPCNECYITGMVAGLEYADGSNANINTGVWLHHMVALSQGAGRRDPTCANNAFSLPHFAVGATGANSERFFASGNERTKLEVPAGLKYGYKVNTADKWSLLVDLMNENLEPKQVYMTMTFNFVPGSSAGYRPMKPLWLDINQCGTSEMPAKTGKYNYKSIPWTSTVTGPWLGVGGHMHDGGTNVTIEQNGQVICNSEAKYATKPEYISGGGGMDHGDGGMDHGHGGMEHISEHGVCYTPALPQLTAGARVGLTAYYDDSVHTQMLHNGRLHNVMGIAIGYVGQ